ERLGARRPEVADVQPDQQVGQRPVLRRLDGRLQVAHRDGTEPFELSDAVPVDRVDVGDVVHELELEELADALLPEALDVHRAPRAEVSDGSGQLERALRVDAPGVALPLRTNERGLT